MMIFPFPSGQTQIKTVFLGSIVKKLAELDKKLASSIIKIDELITKTPLLAKWFETIKPKIDPTLEPFLKKSLIEKTMKDTLATEKLRASNPAYKAMLGDSVRNISAFDDERTYEKFLIALNHPGGTVYGKTPLKKIDQV